MKSQISSVTGEYYRTNIELKDKVIEVKKIANIIIEENEKLNIRILTEFEKLKKSFKNIKKTIVELSTLLTSGSSFSGTGKYNKNIANNRQQIIQNFNSMIIGLMKDIAKGNNSAEFNNEINNVLFPKKKVGSLIKQYIEGRIHAEDTKFEERKKQKYSFNKQKTIDIFKKNSIKNKLNSTPKNEDLPLNYNRLNSDSIKDGIRNKLIPVEIKEITNKYILENNIEKKSTFNNYLNRNKSNFHIIKEENNNKSKSSISLSEDYDKYLNIEEGNILKKKIYSRLYDEDKKSLTKNVDKKKLFLRHKTSNFENKKFNFGNNKDNFKLLLKAQENFERKKIEQKNTFKNDNLNNQNKINTIINSDKTKKDNNNADLDQNSNETKSKNINNNKNETEKIEFLKNNKTEEKAKIPNKIQNFENKVNDTIKSPENKIAKFNIDKKSNEKKIDKNENNQKIETEKESTKNQKSNLDNNNNNSNSSIPIKSKNCFSIKNDIQKAKLNQNNIRINVLKNDILSADRIETKFLMYSKNKNNKISNHKKNTLSLSDTSNLLTSNNKYKNQDNINKNATLTITNKKSPLSIMNSCQTRPSSKFRIKKKNNIFNDDIFLNSDLIKQINYCKDEDIIDKPLLINQIDFKVDNTKGSLENKLLELEYFTKRKLDELVREIKNFIPIHFNAYIKE